MVAVAALQQAGLVTPAVPTPVVRVDCKQLLDEYDAHELAADQRYRGKVIEVTGTVAQTGRSGDLAYVTLKAGGYFVVHVDCKFLPGDEAGAASLEKGEQTVIRGMCRGKGMFGIVTLESATVVSGKP